MFYKQREEFFSQLIKDIHAVQRKAIREDYHKVGIRLNGTSDIRWEVYGFEYNGKQYKNIMELFR